MRKHDAHVREYLWLMRLKSRYPNPWPIAAVFFFMFFIFVMGIYLVYSYAFHAYGFFTCLK